MLRQLLHFLPLLGALPLATTSPISSMTPVLPADRVRTLFQFPNRNSVENLAVRANGMLVMSLISEPLLYMMDPLATDPTPQLLYNFTDYGEVLGIREIAPDIFAVATGNRSIYTGVAVPGEWAVFEIDFRSIGTDGLPARSKIADLPEATFLNGMAVLPGNGLQALEKQNVLVSDTRYGVAFFVNTTSGDTYTAVNNSLTASVSVDGQTPIGINGLEYLNGTLYITNTGLNNFASIPVTEDGQPTGPGQSIRTFDAPIGVDDFTIRGEYVYLTTGGANTVVRFRLDGGGEVATLVGNLNSTQAAQPSACRFGRTERDDSVLYVTTNGGFSQPINGTTTVGGEILALDLEGML